MNKHLRYLLLIAVLSLSSTPSFASRIKNGFEALKVQDYFKAHKLLSKGMKYNPSAASYGLSIVFSRNDNPFYNKDSAYRYILIADSTWDLAKERKKEKWKIFGWTKPSIDSLKKIISTQFFAEAKSIHSVESYTAFINDHPWSNELERAVYVRDSIAFFKVVSENSAEAYNMFIATYPTSEFVQLAQENYYNSEYFEQTKDDSLSSYLKFIDEHPESPMRGDAEKKVFKMVTESNTVEAFELFVLGYSDYEFNAEGWWQFYQVYLFDYSKERMTEFLIKFPDNPIRERIVRDMTMCDSLLLPYNSKNNYGYMNLNGEVVINAIYDYAGSFSEGFAPVSQNGKFGFINKWGELVIPFEYDTPSEFRFGRVITEKDGLYGMLDRNKRLLLGNKYEDLGEPSNGMMYVLQDEKYGYVDLNGNKLIDFLFDEAFDFVGNYALVEVDELQAMINQRGEFMIAPKFDQITPISDSLFVCTLDGRKGVITDNGTFVVSPKYDQIGKFKDGLALVSKSDTIEYINMNGEVVLSKGYKTFPNFLLKGEFENESAIVSKKGKYGRINRKGDVITDIEYQNLGLGGKFIPFQKQDNWGLMSLSNRVLISPLYESLDMESSDRAIARSLDSLGVLDTQGNIIIPFTFNSIEYLKDDYFIVKDETNFGLYNGKNKVLDLVYEQIGLFGDDFLSLVRDGELSYYDLLNNNLIELKVE